MAVSRAELREMDRDELIEFVKEQQRRIEKIGERAAEDRAEIRQQIREDRDEAAKERARTRQILNDEIEDVRQELQAEVDKLHRERCKLARRVTALEEDVGVTATDVLARSECGTEGPSLTKLGRLVRHGPEAVSNDPGATIYRARELVQNWSDWGMVRDDKLGRERRLASKKHQLKTHLEAARNERLSWKQVYRAMEWIAREGPQNVTLEEGSTDEGKYVLVHRPEGDSG